MNRLIISLLFLLFNVVFAQDTLTTVYGQLMVGEYIESADRHIVFHIDGQEEASLIYINSIKKVKLNNNVIVFESGNLEYIDTLPETPVKTLEERQVIAIEGIEYIQRIFLCFTILGVVINIIFILSI